MAPVESDSNNAWSHSLRGDVLGLLNGVSVGVYAWRDRETEQVSASANLGVIREEDGKIAVSCFIRASQQEDTDALAGQHRQTAVQRGFDLSTDSYPAWPERPGNRLTEAVVKVWRKVSGKEMEVAGVHVGLEPSVLGAKNPAMLMVNTGPEIYDPHSLDERAPLEGLADYPRLLAGVMDELSKE